VLVTFKHANTLPVLLHEQQKTTQQNKTTKQQIKHKHKQNKTTKQLNKIQNTNPVLYQINCFSLASIILN
jgi:hypothetical protein